MDRIPGRANAAQNTVIYGGRQVVNNLKIKPDLRQFAYLKN
jgi:hypothetical protein